VSLEQTETNRYNFIKDVSKAFGDVPAAYTDLIDLGSRFKYNHLMLVNSTDTDIILLFENSDITAEYTVPANSSQVLDKFSHNRVVQYKYVSAAPTSGFFKLTSWLGGE